ncbi:MAG: (2Fe-2S)-binding protein [Chloroflexi bacterium]|nr:(2Fe-2S)-binding protein [Chloroflexota bacterium]
MAKEQTVFATRIHAHPTANAFQVEVDGEMVTAYAGETVAAVLMLSGNRTFTQPSRYNLSRTVFCGMGVCHQCLVTVDGVRDMRGCMTQVHPDMQIQTKLPMGVEENETG